MKKLIFIFIVFVCLCSCNNISKYDFITEPVTIEYVNNNHSYVIFNYNDHNVIEEYYGLYPKNSLQYDTVYMYSDTTKNVHITVDGNYVRVFGITPDNDYRILKEFYFNNK